MRWIYLIALSLLIVAGCDDGQIMSSTSAIFSDRCVFSHNLECSEFELSNTSLTMSLYNKGIEDIEVKSASVYLLGPETDRISRECELENHEILVGESINLTCELKDISDIRRNTFRVFMDTTMDGQEVRVEGDFFFANK